MKKQGNEETIWYSKMNILNSFHSISFGLNQSVEHKGRRGCGSIHQIIKLQALPKQYRKPKIGTQSDGLPTRWRILLMETREGGSQEKQAKEWQESTEQELKTKRKTDATMEISSRGRHGIIILVNGEQAFSTGGSKRSTGEKTTMEILLRELHEVVHDGMNRRTNRNDQARGVTGAEETTSHPCQQNLYGNQKEPR